MVFDIYTKARIVHLHSKGINAPSIQRILTKEGIIVSRQGVDRFLRRYRDFGCFNRVVGSGRPSKVTASVKAFVENQMRLDDETTAFQLHHLLRQNGYDLSLATILRCRTSLGWTFRGSAYCQLIRHVNKVKRLEFVELYGEDDFENVIFTDECTVQLETHKRFCCRKKGEAARPKPRPKHPVKVHVWAGISKRGATGVCIFEGIMDRYLYVDVLRRTLVPFIQGVYTDGHRFMADNDPKHTSVHAREWLRDNSINWWRTPAESPDLNPIENLWHELKEFIRREVKPKTKGELVQGIKDFWVTVDRTKCCKYISHLNKVIPKVKELNGEATGY